VSRWGQPVAGLAIGIARPAVPLRPDSLLLWFSVGKPVAAVTIAQLWEGGRLDLRAPVCQYLPEFGVRGKEAVRLDHVLTHRRLSAAVALGGVRRPVLGRDDRPHLRRRPGARLGPRAAGGLPPRLGLVPGRRGGPPCRRRPHDRYVREEIFEPLGMFDAWGDLPPPSATCSTASSVPFTTACRPASSTPRTGPAPLLLP
jgi:CubicO group peptidase (beta-lactamase class C family)